MNDERTNCEIVIAPATIFGVGVSIETILNAIRDRNKTQGGPFELTRKVQEAVGSEPYGYFLQSPDGDVHFYKLEEKGLATTSALELGGKVYPAVFGKQETT